MALAVACYRLAKQLPPEERFELSVQMRRAALSVRSNIAEGHASGSQGVFSHHVRIALGAVGELETHLELAIRTGLLRQADIAVVLEQVTRTGQAWRDPSAPGA